MNPLTARIFRLVCLAALLSGALGAVRPASSARAAASCAQSGWFPTEFGLKDHSVFIFNGYYYLISIYHSYTAPPGEDRFAYARSTDLCVWERLGDVLTTRTPGAADEFRIWAPYVYQESGIYYLYYTGVTDEFTQRILLATSSNPADPAAWQPQGVVFQPNHSGMIWDMNNPNNWDDCRDPFVVKVGANYLMYYTGMDMGGGIIGVATAGSPMGPWSDWGGLLPPSPNSILESPALAQYGGGYYLFYHIGGAAGGNYRLASAPNGPWSEPLALRPGWAHEVWQGSGGNWYASYLTGYSVTIAPLFWYQDGSRTLPLIIEHQQLFPFVMRKF